MPYPRIFIIICLAAFCTLLPYSIVLPMLPLYAARELHASDETVGLVVSSFFIARICIELPGGLIADRIGRRKPIILGMFLSFAGGLVLSLAPNIALLMLGRAVWGAGTALFLTATYSLLFDLFPPSFRGKSTGTFQSVELVGSFIGAPIGGTLAEFFGIKQIFYLSVVILAVGLVITSLYKGLKIEGEVRKGHEHTHFSLKTAVNLFKNWGLIVVSIGAFVRLLLLQGIKATILPIYLDGFGISEVWIGLVVGVSSLGQIFATLISGMITRKTGSKRMLLIGFALDSIAVLSYAFTDRLEFFIPISFLEGSASGIELINLTVLVSDIAPANARGASLGVYRTFLDAGAIVGPIALTFINMATNNVKSCFYFSSLLVAATFFITLTLKETYDKTGNVNY
ncbi:MAG: MFS transporter [Candidatus Bathyarchaeia archaeon]